MPKRIAIIGAGASGLAATKCCLEEGLEPVCMERTGEIGGLWNYSEGEVDSQLRVMRCTVINSSKEMMAFSDFPIPKEFPVYLHHTYVNRYFHIYADHFGLKKYIRLNTEVVSVQPADNFQQTGKWNIIIQNQDKSRSTKQFDALLICTGKHSEGHQPTFDGQERFKGRILHSQFYKDFHGYENKRVVVVGIGNSGGDLAADLSRYSKVFISTRRGSWIRQRLYDHGLPMDMSFLYGTRLGTSLLEVTPTFLTNELAEKRVNKKFDHEKYALKPKHRIFSQLSTINDDLPNRIACGAVTIKSDIKCITATGVEFRDGTFEDNIDVIILATGYITRFPFMDKSTINLKNKSVDLYKYMFPPDVSKHTCAVIGCFDPNGSAIPIIEMQCRLATQVFKGITKLPPKDDMWFDIIKKKAALAQRYVASRRTSAVVNYISMMDELAELVGCKPNFKKLFKTDPSLAWKCLTGPCTPYQFRLMGCNAWAGARDAIFSQWDRTLYPLNTRPVESTSTFLKFPLVHCSFFLFIILMIVHLIF